MASSHFGEAEIPLSLAELFPDRPRLYLSKQHTASKVRFVRIPAGVKEAGWHTTPERLLAVWLDGETEFETSDGKFGAFPLAASFWQKILTVRVTSRVIQTGGSRSSLSQCRTE